jgi:hypothetical protein
MPSTTARSVEPCSSYASRIRERMDTSSSIGGPKRNANTVMGTRTVTALGVLVPSSARRRASG